MQLDTVKYQAQLDDLARALRTVAERQDVADSRDYFRKEMALAYTLSAGLDSAPSWCRISCQIMRDHTNRLAGVCEALADHVSQPAGEAFWKAQFRSLNDLADEIENHLIEDAKPAEDFGSAVTQPLAL